MSSGMPEGRSVLYTLGPSHFSERARWGLDHRAIPYEERRLALGLHAVFLKAKGLPETSLPVLVRGAELIQGSGAILDACAYAVTDREVEARFEGVIGPLVRRFIYAAAFASEDAGMIEVLLDGVPAAERVAGLAVWPALRARIQRGLRAGEENRAEIDSALDAELDWFDAIVGGRGVQDGPLGDGFGRTDITAASLLSPLAAPAASPIKRRPRFSPAVVTRLTQMRQRPCLRWVERIYAGYRHAPEGHPI